MFEVFRQVENIKIDKIALHIVNNRDKQFVQSEEEIDLQELDEKLLNYIHTHILKSLKEERSRIAKFINPKTHVQNWCNEILTDPDEYFLSRSQSISKHLYNSMHEDNRIAPGDLLVILYTDLDRNTKTIALLKMDYNDTVSRKVETDPSTGFKKIKLVVIGENFPNLRQKLQKVAFIRNTKGISNPDEEPALLVLDRDQGEQDKIANFFKNDFLACEVFLTDDTKTVELYKRTNQWIASQPDNEYNKNLLQTVVNDIRMEKNINIYDLATSVFGNDEDIKEDTQLKSLKESYIQNLLNGIGDPDLKATQSEKLNRILNNKKIKTTDNIEIVGPIELIEEKIEYINKRPNENGEEICDIIIKGVTLINNG